MNERQERIYKIISKIKNATIEHLCNEVYASPATIRRDLSKMENEGLIARVWGGAVLMDANTLDPPKFVRSNANLEAKKLIARKALSFISENSSLFLPSGTTIGAFCNLLPSLKDVIVITNSLDAVNSLSETSSFKIYSLGGELYEGYDFVGRTTLNSIEKFSADYLLFSCSGITEDGFTANDINRLDVIEHMQKNAKKTILLCDTSKVNKKCMYNGFDFSKIDLVIMEKAPSNSALMQKLKDKLIIV